jgi:ABC-2 type transport system ATP-binding protein
VEGFDLEVSAGEMVGLVGPNGAGKTTLVKMLSGIIRPSAGVALVLGETPHKRADAYLSRMAVVMGQKTQLWWDLPAMDTFLLSKAMYGIKEARFRSNLGRLAESLEVTDLLDRPVRKLSLGQRMRMEFIAAMLHEPDLVFLDEPTIGLDAPAQKKIREFLREENALRGMTLILTSHYMEDIRKLCPRSVLISSGRKRWDGPTEGMLDSVRGSPDEDIADTVERLYATGGQDGEADGGNGEAGGAGKNDSEAALALKAEAQGE